MFNNRNKNCNKSPVLLVHTLNEPTCLWRLSTDHAYHQFWTPRQTSPHFLSILTTAIIKDSVIFSTRAHTHARARAHTHAHTFPSHVGPWRICDIYDFFAPHINVLTYLLTHPFNGPLSRTTRVSRYQKGKTSLDFTEERQWVAVASAGPFAPDR